MIDGNIFQFKVNTFQERDSWTHALIKATSLSRRHNINNDSD